jgi:hypothetical protein
MILTDTKSLKDAVRMGNYNIAGYPMFFITKHGCTICPNCVKRNFKQYLLDFRDNSFDKLIAIEVNYECPDMSCEECGKDIPSAYGND